MSNRYLFRLCISFSLLGAFCIPTRAQAPEQAATLKISGEVSTPLTLHAADLTSMTRTGVRAKDHDEKEHSFSGVTLADILQKAGAALGAQLRGRNMSAYLLTKSKDGYQVVFALAELDSGYTDRSIILADMEDGKPLPADKGPFHIIVPGEKKHARWSWGVTELIVKSGRE